MADIGLQAVLDFILNRAEPAEFEVVLKACERRRQDMGRYAKLGGMNPATMADRMAASINEGVASSIESLRDTVRSYVERIIREQAPEAGEAEVAALLRHYIPDPPATRSNPPGGTGLQSAGGETGLYDTEKAERLPPEALVMMIRDFTDYSLGLMPPSRQKELWDWIADWQDKYWSAFPPELKAFVKARLEGKLDDEDFWGATLGFLGL
jgi:hypothetical protein